MSAIQGLKKQLRGVRSTQKLTKAMRTVSTVKYAKLSKLYSDFDAYGNQCKRLLEQFGAAFGAQVRAADPQAPATVLVMCSNKGMCGSFNAEILKFALEEIAKLDRPLLVPCGKKAIAFFKGRNILSEKEAVLDDVPTFAESSALLDELLAWRRSGKTSKVYVIYPRYVNMLQQEPVITQLFPEADGDGKELLLVVPDQDTVAERIGPNVFRAMFYGLVMQSALGAQAATLMTMRAAYDTATEYCDQLEGQINRLRQSIVTASVIETSADSRDS